MGRIIFLDNVYVGKDEWIKMRYHQYKSDGDIKIEFKDQKIP